MYRAKMYTVQMTATLLDVKLELVGPAELTQALGVSRTRANQLFVADGFPKPIAELVMGKIWDLEEIRQWAARAGRELHPVTQTSKRSGKD